MKTRKVPERFRRVKGWFSQGRLLDIGCGKGELAEYINSELYGIERNQIKAEIARTKSYKEVIIGDIEKNIPFLSSYFDVVVCAEVLEHLLDPRKALRNIYRLLKPDGLLLVSVPNPQGLRRFLFDFHDEFIGLKNEGDVHYHYGTAKQWQGFLKKERFKIIHIEGLGFPLIHRFKILGFIRQLLKRFADTFFIVAVKKDI